MNALAFEECNLIENVTPGQILTRLVNSGTRWHVCQLSSIIRQTHGFALNITVSHQRSEISPIL